MCGQPWPSLVGADAPAGPRSEWMQSRWSCAITVQVPAPQRADPDTVAWNVRSLGSNVRTRPAEAMLWSRGNDRIAPYHKIPFGDSQSSRQRDFHVRICFLVSKQDLAFEEKS